MNKYGCYHWSGQLESKIECNKDTANAIYLQTNTLSMMIVETVGT